MDLWISYEISYKLEEVTYRLGPLDGEISGDVRNRMWIKCGLKMMIK
jgi:hypothetical protein